MNTKKSSDRPVAVSVVIPTWNRSRLLRELIESLWEQTLDPKDFEIVVIDNVSVDDTPAMMKRLQSESPCRLLYHRMPSNEGSTRSRNLGARLAGGEILALTDSDCRAHPEWLARGVEAFRKTPELAFVSGAILDKPEQEVTFFTLRNGAGRGENWTYPSANIFYRRQLFLEMGSFDESTWVRDIGSSPVACYDTDLAWRVKKAGHPYRYLEDLIVYHEVSKVTPRQWILYPLRVLVAPELVRRHPELRRNVLRWGLFLSPENALFYPAVAGVLLGLTLQGWFFLLALPFLYWAATVQSRCFSLRRIHRVLARTVLFSLQRSAMCGALLYGSIRSRTLVL